MGRMKNKTRIGLFVVGVLLQFAALLGEHATEIPLVLRVIAPRYYHASAGIKALVQAKELRTGEEGHAEVGAVLCEWVRSKLPAQSKTGKEPDIGHVGNITSGGTAAIGNDTYVTAIWFRIASSNVTMYGYAPGNPEPNNFVWGLEQLKEKVDDIKQPNVLAFCFGLFILGTILDVVAFFMENSEPAARAEDLGDRKEKTQACA